MIIPVSCCDMKGIIPGVYLKKEHNAKIISAIM